MRTTLSMVFVGSLLFLWGCAEPQSGKTQAIVIDTTPKGGALCVAQNEHGSWTVAATPGVVVVPRSAAPLAVSCRTADDWLGGTTVTASPGLLAFTDSLHLSGDTNDADYDYPGRVTISLLEVDSETLRPMFGAEGGRHIPKPQDPAADLARQQDDNLASRFQTLRLLLEEGLITAEEYNLRRGANIGALLRYTKTPGARDLERPPPRPTQVLARLHYLAAAYAEHAISASEQAAERSTILEGLLPLKPPRRADPPPPIKSELQLAAELGRTERLRLANAISDKEAATEKAKVYELLSASLAAADAAALAANGVSLVPAAAANGRLTGFGIALSTHSSESQAKRIWAGLKKVYPDQLGPLTLQLRAVPRPHRPSHYRITAGPLADQAAARELCGSLKRHDIACEPTSFGN